MCAQEKKNILGHDWICLASSYRLRMNTSVDPKRQIITIVRTWSNNELGFRIKLKMTIIETER